MPFEKKPEYEQDHRIEAQIGGRAITFSSKPGIEDWEHVKPAENLIADKVDFAPIMNAVVLGCRHGALPAALACAYPNTSFTFLQANWLSSQAVNQTINAHQIRNAIVQPYPSDGQLDAGAYHAAVILIPKGRNLARRWILEAYNWLVPGGNLLICGANEAGIQSIIKDAGELFTESEILGYKKGERVARFGKKKERDNFPDWARTNGIVPGTWLEFDVDTGEFILRIRSLPGVFSSDHLDEGTNLLLKHIEVPHNARVLDIGCGYGVIGMSAAKKQSTAQVEMVDADLLSVASSAENIRINQLGNVSVFASDLLSACQGKSYQLILANPPFHSGKKTNYLITEAMIHQAYNSLASTGEFTLVANRFLRYEKLMEKYFSTVFIKAQTSKFHVITGVR